MASVEAANQTHEASSLNRRVLNLAWPVVVEQLLETLLGLVDTLLVARLGERAVAGVGNAVQLFVILIVGLSALATGVTILIAQAIGAGDVLRANRLVKQAVVWSIILSIPFALFGILGADWLIGLLGATEPQVRHIGADYLRVVMGAVVLLVLLFAVGSALRGAGDSRTPMYVTAVANLVNIAAAWALIYGNIGLPALGPVDSAWAATIGRAVGLALMLYLLIRGSRILQLDRKPGWWPQPHALGNILRFGLPNAAQQVLTEFAFLLLTIIVIPLGTTALAAHRILFNAFQLSFLPGFGFAIAATALVGQAVGAKNETEARQAGNIATRWGILWMGSAGLLYFIFAPQIIEFFLPGDAAAVAVGTLPLRLLAIVQPFWAILFVQSGALEGAGMVIFPAVAMVLGVYGTLLVAWLATSLGFGLAGVWGSFLFSPILALIIFWRFQTARLVRT